MNEYAIETIIVSDINRPGFLAEIYVNGKEIGYVEQKAYQGAFESFIHRDADSEKIPNEVLDTAMSEGLHHLENFVKNKLPEAY